MILVTVGTYKSEELVKIMDQIAPDLDEEVIAQIGQGRYEPKNLRYFRFAPCLDEYYEKADIVVGHGGLATIFELLYLGKHFVGVSSKAVHDLHQNDLLEKLSHEGYIVWCKEIGRLKECIERARNHAFKKYSPSFCDVERVILDFLETCS